jgi:hypothetical protein
MTQAPAGPAAAWMWQPRGYDDMAVTSMSPAELRSSREAAAWT